MQAVAESLAQIQQPGNAGMGRLGHRAMDVEMEHRLGRAGTMFGHPAPAGAAGARSTIANQAITHEIHIGVLGIRGPVALKVLQKRGPIRLQVMHFEIAQRKRKPVIDADDRRDILGQALGEPLGNAASRPVLARARWRRHFLGCRSAIGAIDPQPLQAGIGRLGTGIVDADVAGEGRGHRRAGWTLGPVL